MEKLNLLLMGASGGIGRKLAPLLSEKYNVLTHGNRGSAQYHCDVRSYAQVGHMMENITLDVRPNGMIDVLVNLAGVFVTGAIHKCTTDEIDDTIDINLKGTINIVRAILPGMRFQRFGRIITISTVLNARPEFGTGLYSASKAGIEGLTRAVSKENATHGITANCIALGYMNGGMFERAPEGHRQTVLASIPSERAGHVEELQRTIDWIVDTPYVTGQVINLSGGLI